MEPSPSTVTELAHLLDLLDRDERTARSPAIPTSAAVADLLDLVMQLRALPAVLPDPERSRQRGERLLARFAQLYRSGPAW